MNIRKKNGHLLCKFFVNIRKKNGQEYEPDSISSFQRSIQRYLSEKGSSVSILKDKDFEKSSKVLAAKRLKCFNTRVINCSTRSCVARVFKSTDIARSVSSPKKTMPYNKLLTNLACSSRTGEYWPSRLVIYYNQWLKTKG